MPRLLNHLARFDVFSRQSEVLCTQGLAFFLKDPLLRRAFAELVLPEAYKKSGAELRWKAEARQNDGCRPDLEGRDSMDKAVVKLEAKLGASLTEQQLTDYANDLQKRAGAGVLLVLVPKHRFAEAKKVLASAQLPASISGSVWSWEEVIDHLLKAGNAELSGDLEQFEAMYQVLSGTDVAPLAGEDVLRRWRERELSFRDYVDRATRILSENGPLYPLGLDSKTMQDDQGISFSDEVASGKPKDASAAIAKGNYFRRYVLCTEQVVQNSYFALGIRDPFASYDTPIWLRFHAKTGEFGWLRERLRNSALWSRIVESEGHLWLPIEPKIGEGPEVIDSVVEQAKAICEVAVGDSSRWAPKHPSRIPRQDTADQT